nr:MAG TPA: hypothetical protein [Caudoviricetes sp.]
MFRTSLTRQTVYFSLVKRTNWIITTSSCCLLSRSSTSSILN